MTLSINKNEYENITAEFLAESLIRVDEMEFCEVWLSEPEGASLCCLKNQDRCFLMYLRFEGDADFTAHTTAEDETKRVKFILSNGQADYYPSTWTVSYQAGKQALEYFYSTKAMDGRLTWQAH